MNSAFGAHECLELLPDDNVVYAIRRMDATASPLEEHQYLEPLTDDNVIYAIRRVDDEDATESSPGRNVYLEVLPDDVAVDGVIRDDGEFAAEVATDEPTAAGGSDALDTQQSTPMMRDPEDINSLNAMLHAELQDGCNVYESIEDRGDNEYEEVPTTKVEQPQRRARLEPPHYEPLQLTRAGAQTPERAAAGVRQWLRKHRLLVGLALCILVVVVAGLAAALGYIISIIRVEGKWLV